MELWDDEENRAFGDSKQALAINEKLDDLRAELKFHYKELKRHDVWVTAEQIRDAYLGTTVKNNKLLEIFKEYNNGLNKREGKDLSSATVAKYNRTYKRMTEHIKEKHKRKLEHKIQAVLKDIEASIDADPADQTEEHQSQQIVK